MIDITRIDKITRKNIQGKDISYSDFFVNFNIHPETRNLLKYIDDSAVKRSIRNLILTNKGEAPFQPDKGCNLKYILFEPISDISEDLLRTYISETLSRYEPRILVSAIIIASDIKNNLYEVSIIYEIKTKNSPTSSINLTLNRIR